MSGEVVAHLQAQLLTNSAAAPQILLTPSSKLWFCFPCCLIFSFRLLILLILLPLHHDRILKLLHSAFVSTYLKRSTSWTYFGNSTIKLQFLPLFIRCTCRMWQKRKQFFFLCIRRFDFFYICAFIEINKNFYCSSVQKRCPPVPFRSSSRIFELCDSLD